MSAEKKLSELTDEEKGLLLRSDTKSTELPAAYLPAFVLRAFEQLETYISTGSTSWSDVVQRLERVENGFAKFDASDAPGTAELRLVRQDADAALREAREAATSGRLMIAELRKLRSAFEDASVTVLRARLKDLENLVDRHISNHPGSS